MNNRQRNKLERELEKKIKEMDCETAKKMLYEVGSYILMGYHGDDYPIIINKREYRMIERRRAF